MRYILVPLLLLLEPIAAMATDDHIRLDKTQVTINIDWQGNVTGNDPIHVWISRDHGGTGCTPVSNALILVERPPLNCSGVFDTGNPCYGGPLHEPINIAGVWTQAHVATQLCNVNESDVWYWQGKPDNSSIAVQPTSFYPFPSVDSNPYIKLSDWPTDSVNGDGKSVLDPKAFCNQVGRPGSWTHTFVVRMIWDPHIGGYGFFQGLINGINDTVSNQHFDLSWTGDNNNGKADTTYSATINCLAPPPVVTSLTLSPDFIQPLVEPAGNVLVLNTPNSILTYTDAACVKPMISGAVFSKQQLDTPGAAPASGPLPVLIGGNNFTQSGEGCSARLAIMANPVLPAESTTLCKDPVNSGKTVSRTQTVIAQFCATGDCKTYGTADATALAKLSVDVICPMTVNNPVVNNAPPNNAGPVPLASAPNLGPAPTSLAAAATASGTAVLATGAAATTIKTVKTAAAPLYPGTKWTMTLPSGPQIWTFDSRDGDNVYFDDINGYNATIRLLPDGKSLTGAYDSCAVTGTLGNGSAILKPAASQPECRDKFGAEIQVTIK